MHVHPDDAARLGVVDGAPRARAVGGRRDRAAGRGDRRGDARRREHPARLGSRRRGHADDVAARATRARTPTCSRAPTSSTRSRATRCSTASRSSSRPSNRRTGVADVPAAASDTPVRGLAGFVAQGLGEVGHAAQVVVAVRVLADRELPWRRCRRGTRAARSTRSRRPRSRRRCRPRTRPRAPSRRR